MGVAQCLRHSKGSNHATALALTRITAAISQLRIALEFAPQFAGCGCAIVAGNLPASTLLSYRGPVGAAGVIAA